MLKQTWARATSLLDPVASLRNQVGSLREQLALANSEVRLARERLRSAGEHCTSVAKVAASSFASLRWLLEDRSRARPSTTPLAQPLISIIMPVYNRQHTVAAAIASVQAQTYPAWELLVLDDGSSQRTRAVLAGF